jgi:hypothetical protein
LSKKKKAPPKETANLFFPFFVVPLLPSTTLSSPLLAFLIYLGWHSTMESSDDDDDGKFLANLLEQHNFAEPNPGDDSEWTKNIPIVLTEVDIDNVNKYLLAKARSEVEVVKTHFMIQILVRKRELVNAMRLPLWRRQQS